MSLDKWMMVHIHFYCVIQNAFSVLEILCALPVHLFLPQLIFYFTIAMILPSPEYHIVGII